jgi:hypothetical protein
MRNKVIGKLHMSLRYDPENDTWVKQIRVGDEIRRRRFDSKEEAIDWEGEGDDVR